MKSLLKKAPLLLALLALPLLALAQAAPAPFVPLTNLPGITEAGTAASLPNFLNNLYRLCIGAAAVIAVIQIMRAGAYFMFNKGSITQNQQAKELIQNSILGLLLVLSPAIVFGIINPDILDLKLDISNLELGDVEKQSVNNVVNDTRCEIYESGSLKSGFQGCSSIGEGYREVSSACCEGSVLGSACCARPKSNSEQASKEYTWRFFVAQDQEYSVGQGTTFGQPPPPAPRVGSRHETQEACRTEYSAAVGVAQLNGQEIVVECDCSKSGSYPACKI